ncbi:hypothetical protein MNEG_7150 [Monoraphidium neglectum]|uniref:CRM domain-containing protein n=1 Tax=Monoraphidium neglectum TaxID=145388 RepID=A0A0D2JNT8_9CHLO|nr:hypothetical protein MNEG_7150 [Monoraphidium neglectum]KIZ00813.1 hypothetical protein MNEG_7150 [Monoraphidium neglectum]|eukprot:XP_013899832.1 hypothetical protein MNEG_7150 [Monoraphidium neglectum]
MAFLLSGRGAAASHTRTLTRAGPCRYVAVARVVQPHKWTGTRSAPSAVCASAQDAEAPTTSSGASSSAFTDEQQRLLWDSVSRALLRLGKSGATEAHGRSLCELLRAHKLVKVQINGPADAAAAVAASLSADSGGVLLQTKGGTLLFAEGDAEAAALLQVANESAGKTAVWREKRMEQREKRQQLLATTTAKREANASRSRRRIGKMISNVSSGGKGKMSREGLLGEWQQLAAGIAAEEAGEAAAAAAQGGPAPKQPWKRAAAQKQQQQQQQQQPPRSPRQQ